MKTKTNVKAGIAVAPIRREPVLAAAALKVKEPVRACK